MSAAPQPATKPVTLQVNTSGAWKNVVNFDAAKEAEAAEVMEAAAVLGRASQAKFRVVIQGMQTVLSHWTPEKGWVAWK